jgi:hypothetical protein
MVNPLLDVKDFQSGIAFRNYLERSRAHTLAGETGLRHAAAEIRSLIRAGGGQMNPRAYLNARRIARPLIHAADLHHDAAQMFALCLALHRGAFPPVNADSGARRAHNGNG